jgi:acetyl-CoA synthetase
MDALLPSLYFGRPIVAYNGRFSPELAFEILDQHQITHSFLFPTALKAMMKAEAHPRQKYRLVLQGLMSAGEAVGDAVFAYCRDELGIVVNEMFGQTEINYVVGNCHIFWPPKPGSMGRAYPGHWVAVIDADGQICKAGESGEVAVSRYDRHGHPDPVFFLGYWKNDKATEDKFTQNWCRTGDVAIQDEEGYLWYQGRTDDMFKAAGYRIGPGEIENCLVKHPAVVNAAVVPKPDADRGAVVKAYVVLSPDFLSRRAKSQNAQAFDQKVISDLQVHVRGLLAPYEYPKEIEFIDQLPMTTTGKVQRRFLRLEEERRAKMA